MEQSVWTWRAPDCVLILSDNDAAITAEGSRKSKGLSQKDLTEILAPTCI